MKKLFFLLSMILAYNVGSQNDLKNVETNLKSLEHKQLSEERINLINDPGTSTDYLINDIIELPIRFHILNNITMTKKGVNMDMWLTSEDIEETILPEINRIWQKAGIKWFIEIILVEDPANISNIEKTLQYIANSDRETPERVKKIVSLFDPKKRHPVVHNIYFVPFVGGTTQGFASMGGNKSFDSNPDGGNQSVVGVWTDKPTNAKEPPQKFPLKEALPFKIGSIARTCSHELGHTLLLQHPSTKKQTQLNRLMGGKRPNGYDLTSEEIAMARRIASGRAETILKWADANAHLLAKNDKKSKDYKQEKVTEDIETYPIYPGCDHGDNNFKMKCMSQNIVNFVNKNFNVKIAIKSGLKGVHQVNVSYTINLEGNITRINAKGPNSEVEEEAIRVIKLLPKMKPGYQKGKPVSVPYTLPFRFEVK